MGKKNSLKKKKKDDFEVISCNHRYLMNIFFNFILLTHT